MSRLFAVEVSRFTSRRATRAFVVGALLGILAAGVLTFVFSDRDIAGATASARADVTAAYEECVRSIPLERPGVDPAAFCPTPDLSQVTSDPRFHLTSLRDVLAGASAPLVLLGLVLGASFVGAEWGHRTMTTLLTWEPRRARVGLAKFGACAAVVAIGVIVVQVLLGAALVPAAAFRGSTAGTSASWFAGLVGVGMRGSAAAAVASVFGGAVALIARNTTFAVGVWFGWLAVVEGILRATKPGWARWLVGGNAASLVAGTGEGPRTTLGAGLMLALYAVGIGALAIASFRSRDVA